MEFVVVGRGILVKRESLDIKSTRSGALSTPALLTVVSIFHFDLRKQASPAYKST